MDGLIIIALLFAANFVWSAWTQHVLLRQIELDRRSLDHARAEIVALKNPAALAVVAQADQARSAGAIADMLREERGQIINGTDPDEELYG